MGPDRKEFKESQDGHRRPIQKHGSNAFVIATGLGLGKASPELGLVDTTWDDLRVTRTTLDDLGRHGTT